jgi:putative oxidoreductase
MKKFFSINYSSGAFNFSMLLLRVFFGGLMIINHGMPKIMQFATLQAKFYNFMGMGTKVSLLLTLLAEIFCSLFVAIGLFTRLTVIPLIIMLFVIIFMVNPNGSLADNEPAILFLIAFITILLCGPGRISVDGLMKK